MTTNPPTPKPVPYWTRVIASAKKKKGKVKFTEEQKERSKNWFSCACERLDERIKRDSKGMPLDSKMAFLGADFSSSIIFDNPHEAARVLHQIEQRERELIKEME